jgi:hypothetical protein
MAAGDPILASDYAAIKRTSKDTPVCRLVQAAAQSMPDNVATALTFAAGSEVTDNDGFHDTVTNNTRITPTFPGWYLFTGAVYLAAATTPVTREAYFRQNGATSIAPGSRDVGLAITSAIDVEPAYIYCNGTTDYVELICRQDSAAAVNTNVASQQTSAFGCTLVRQTA